MMNMEIVNNEKEYIQLGDAVLYSDSLYFAMPLISTDDNRIVFMCFAENGTTSIWDSKGIRYYKSNFDTVKEHFNNRDITIIPREKININIKVELGGR
jgi:hypothetical protein